MICCSKFLLLPVLLLLLLSLPFPPLPPAPPLRHLRLLLGLATACCSSSGDVNGGAAPHASEFVSLYSVIDLQHQRQLTKPCHALPGYGTHRGLLWGWNQ